MPFSSIQGTVLVSNESRNHFTCQNEATKILAEGDWTGMCE